MNKKYLNILLLLPLVFSSCKNKEDNTDDLKEETPQEEVVIHLEEPKDGEIKEIPKINIHTKVQQAFFNDSIDNVNLYARGVEELSRPVSPTFTWDGGNNKHTVYISENADYSDSKIYEVNKSEVSLTNLKIDTTYYFKAVSSNIAVYETSFTTSDEIIRNVYVSGVTNVRDLGGYKVGENKLKQGLIYRTGRLNQNSTETVTNKINANGIKTMLEDLKVKSEIDLREVSNNEVGGLNEPVGVLGDSVRYYQCPMDYTNLTSELNRDSVKKVFEILGNKENYPTFFHCSIGTDRTGYIAWLINAYLGVSEENLYRDYLFSNFGNIGGSRSVSSISGGYVSQINALEGDSLSEKSKNHLLSLGVNESDLNTLKEMML